MPRWWLRHWCKVTASSTKVGAGGQNRRQVSRRWYRASVTRVGEDGRSSSRLPQEMRRPIQGSALSRSAEGWSNKEGWAGHSQCKERREHRWGTACGKKPSSWLPWENLIQLMLLHFMKESPFLSTLLGFSFLSLIGLLGTQFTFVSGEHEHFENQKVWLLVEAQMGIFYSKPLKFEPRCW